MWASAKESFLKGEIDLVNDDIRVILVDLADYTFSSGHDFLDDVASAARVNVTAMAGMSTTNGVFDANDTVMSSVSGDQSEALIIYKHTGTESTSPLILFIDTGVTGLPVTPDGTDITITWDANGIFDI